MTEPTTPLAEDKLARYELLPTVIRRQSWGAVEDAAEGAAAISGITYMIGDATDPAGDGPRVIAHVSNDAGKWGAGFSGALSKRWRQPERDYRTWFRESRREPDAAWAFGLGRNWTTRLGGDLFVTSMVAQHGIRGAKNPVPIRYEALAECLTLLAIFARWQGASVHMPRIGCGLAGGRWDRVEPLIVANLCDRGVPVTVYDLAVR